METGGAALGAQGFPRGSLSVMEGHSSEWVGAGNYLKFPSIFQWTRSELFYSQVLSGSGAVPRCVCVGGGGIPEPCSI